MKYSRVIFIVAAALLCAAASALAHEGPGRAVTTMLADQTIPVGHADVWNNGKKIVDIGGEEVDIGSKLMVQVFMDEGWYMSTLHVHVSYDGLDPIPVTKKGAPIPGQFNCAWEFDELKPTHVCVYDLEDDFDFSWGTHNDRSVVVTVHADVVQLDEFGNVIAEEGAWSHSEDESCNQYARSWGWWYTYELAHPMRGQFIDAPVKGLGYVTPTHAGVTGENGAGGFHFFPSEWIDLFIGPPIYDPDYSFYLGTAETAKKISPIDLYHGADTSTPSVIGVARTLQTLDSDGDNGVIHIASEVATCFVGVANTIGFDMTMFGDEAAVTALLDATILGCDGAGGYDLIDAAVTPDDAKGNLEAGLNASGIFRKNISKTEDWGETKQKEDVMPVYFPGTRSNGDPSLCVDVDEDGIYDEGDDQLGVPYEEWRLNGDPLAAECDPRQDTNGNEIDDGEEGLCVVTLIECREVGKPLLVTYMEKIDIYDDQVTTDFWPGRFAWDVYTAISRDDGTTWKRMNVSRMADLSSFDLETEEPFPGTSGSPYLKVDDNYILVVWESKFCKSGNPRYSINLCDNPDTPEVGSYDPLTGENNCEIYCHGNPDEGTEVCEPDYPFDDAYYVTDIWGVRGQQQSVNYDEVDDVAELGIGEIPYSCLWATRGVIVSAKELANGTFASLEIDDNLDCTAVADPYDCCTGAGTGTCDVRGVELGDIVWYKPERITSGRRDAYIPVVNSARGAGFAIAWQEDPDGLRPGKGKGPGEGWSGAISNHKTDIWYTFIKNEDFAQVDENFQPGGPPPDSGPDEKPGLGRPKALVPFSLPVRVSDNDMVNTNTLKVQPSTDCVTPPDGTEPVCFPEIVDGTFVALDEDEIAVQFCDHPDANPDTCCDPEHHSPDDPDYDADCEDLKGLFGNLSGTKRYAYLARTVDDNNDGVPDYQYYENRGGTLNLCDLSGANSNSYIDDLPGTQARERWYGFVNAAGASKLVCVTSDGRLLDGDVFASRPMLQLQPYTKPDGTKSAWALLAYEESKGMGHSLVAAEHEDEGDEIIGRPDDPGQDKPIKQDLGKNMLYHSFDFAEPDLVAPGHIVNLPALCGGLYPAWCGEDYTGTNPTCFCEPGQPVPLYFDDLQCANPDDPETCEWMPDPNLFLQYRTEIARRARFLVQSPGKMGDTDTLGALIFKQGQEGQGRPADVFIRRFVKSGQGNPYKFENLECNAYLDEYFTLPACPNGAGDKPSAVGYNCNIWGEASGDRLCGGVFADPDGGYLRRDHINLTSANIDLAADAGPDDDTPDDPTDDIYGTNKVLLWSQHVENLGNESFGTLDGAPCDVLTATEPCPSMYSNARSHRGFIRGDFFAIAYALSPNWAAARNGNDRYNFYVRKSFDGGQTWTTTTGDLGGEGVYFCPEFRTDPDTHEPPIGAITGYGIELAEECVDWCPPDDLDCILTGGVDLAAGAFEPARNISQIKSNHETSADPRLGATPPTYPLDGRSLDNNGNLVNLCPGNPPACTFVEDEYADNIFFVAWGTADNSKSTGGDSLKTEATPLDLFYTRTQDYGDHYLKIPWVIGGENSNQGVGETVWRYDYLAKGEPEEQGECQLRATSDGSKMYAIFHSAIPEVADPDEPVTRWYPWKPDTSFENDLWFRRVIFWPDLVTTP